MPIIAQKTHDPAVYQQLAIMRPGGGGLNTMDLEYTLPVNQSPNMLNMCYKNGVFGKRYGQELVNTDDEDSNVAASIYYKDLIFYAYENGKIYTYSQFYNRSRKIADLGHTLKDVCFFICNGFLYFIGSGEYKTLNETNGKWEDVKPYVPHILMNCMPDGSSGDLTSYSYNRIGNEFTVSYRGDGETKEYKIPREVLSSYSDSVYKYSVTAVTVGVSKTTDYSFSGYTVTFNTAPEKATNDNVYITYQVIEVPSIISDEDEESVKPDIKNCHIACSYGGNNATHLFLAGDGSSMVYYSEALQPEYFPDDNYIQIGKGDSDVTGLAIQFDVLMVFKPDSIYSITYSYEKDTNGNYNDLYTTKPVTTKAGCDAPHTIQYVDNRLTWLNTTYGVCILCSTDILDERNVIPISRNINGGVNTPSRTIELIKSGDETITGLLKEPDLYKARSIDYDHKYILFINSHCYVWDYGNAPYSVSSKYSNEQAASNTAWYFWDKVWYQDDKDTYFPAPIVLTQTELETDSTCYYFCGKYLCKFDNNLVDYDKNPIHAIYQTPMFDFQNFQSLKTIKKAFFEVRARVGVNTEITYLTDEDEVGERDAENMIINGRLWNYFKWRDFTWSITGMVKTFSRKCSIKKVMLFGCKLENNNIGQDLPLSAAKFEYTVVKEIK